MHKLLPMAAGQSEFVGYSQRSSDLPRRVLDRNQLGSAQSRFGTLVRVLPADFYEHHDGVPGYAFADSNFVGVPLRGLIDTLRNVVFIAEF